MRSVGAAVVLVLMVLRTAALSETTIPPPPTTQCPDLSWCSGTCYVDTDLLSGCPTCICLDWGCWFSVECGPDEHCVESHEPPYGVCVPNHETTMTPDGPETSGESEESEESRASGLPTELITGTSEESWESEESGASGLPTESITETTSPPPPTTQCPDLSWCSGTCYVHSDLLSGCPTCICLDWGCWFSVECGPDEHCVESHEPPYGVCVPNHETTMTPDGPETSGESEKSEESRASGLPTEPITGTSEESWESEESGASRLPTESITEPCLTQTDPCTA